VIHDGGGAVTRDRQQRLRLAQGKLGEVTAIAADGPQEGCRRLAKPGGNLLKPFRKAVSRVGIGWRRPMIGYRGVAHMGRGWP
jgi:hypothetical protein